MTRLCKGAPKSTFCIFSKLFTIIFWSGAPTRDKPTAIDDFSIPVTYILFI